MPQPNKDNVSPRFFKAAVPNQARTKTEGRPIFDEVEMVEVILPGDRLTKPSFVVDDTHRQRWPEAYAAFKRGEERAVIGTPLEVWPVLTTGRVAELKAINIFSVDDLAAVSDANVPALGPGGRALRDQAKAFIESAKDGALVARQAGQIAQMQEQIAGLLQQVKVLTSTPVAPVVEASPEAPKPAKKTKAA